MTVGDWIINAVGEVIDQARADGTLAIVECTEVGFGISLCADATACCRCGSADGVEGYELAWQQGRGYLAVALTMCSACAVRAEIEREEIEHG